MIKKKIISIIIIIFFNLITNTGIFYSLGEGDSWNRTWGSDYDDWCVALDIDSSDNIYIIGRTNELGDGESDIFLLKYDTLGNFIWDQIWDNYSKGGESMISIDSLDNIYIAGNTNWLGENKSDIFLKKYDNSGNLLWNRSWGGDQDDHCSTIGIDSSDNIYIAGGTESFGLGVMDMLLLKYNSSGALLLNYTWGDLKYESCYGLAIDSFDKIYITCYSDFYSFEGTSTLIKCDTSGKFQWNRTWNDKGPAYCAVDSLGNIVVAGYKNSHLLLKYNNLGIQIWNTTIGGKVEFTGDIAIDSQDNIYITGHHKFGCNRDGFATTCFYMALNIYNSSGQLKNELQCYRIDSKGNVIAFDSSENLYIAGVTWTNSLLTQDIVLLKNPTEYVEDYNTYYIYYYIFIPIGILCIVLIIIVFYKVKKKKLIKRNYILNKTLFFEDID